MRSGALATLLATARICRAVHIPSDVNAPLHTSTIIRKAAIDTSRNVMQVAEMTGAKVDELRALIDKFK